MPNKKITQLSSAEATVAAIFPVVVSGANLQLGLRDILAGLGIPQYVETTCRATAAVTLPRCNIFDIYVKPLVGSSAQDGGSYVEIGTSADSVHFATIATSGGGSSGSLLTHARPDEWGSMANTIGASGAVIAAAPTASAGASFVVGIGYFRV